MAGYVSPMSEYKAQLMNRGAYVLGSGAFGTVFGHDSAPNHVLKVAQGCDNAWELWAQWVAQNGYAGSFGPTVTSFAHHKKGTSDSFWCATMERLDATVGQLCYRHDSAEDKRLGKHMYNVLGYGEGGPEVCGSSNDACEQRWPGFTGFCVMARNAGFGYDWSSSNWMVNKDRSRIVLTDPQCDDNQRRLGPSVRSTRWRVRNSSEIIVAGGYH